MSSPEFRLTKTALLDTAVSTTVSAAVEMYKGYSALAVITDAAWDTQDMTFQGSADGTNFFPIYYEGILEKITGALASKAYTLKFLAFLPYRYIKIVSGAAQGDDTTLTVILG